MSLTGVVRDIRKKQKRRHDPPDRPTAVWTGRDLLDGEQITALTIIFQTSGCRWKNCTMCGYVYDSAAVQPLHDDIMKQLDRAMEKCKDEEIILKIFTSGSFLDNSEIEPDTRRMILSRLNEDPRIKKVIAETRPEYVTDEKLSAVSEVFKKKFEVAIGIETSSDLIRKDCINKGFSFSDFTHASLTAKKNNMTVKAYLMQKPIFLSEGTAMNDMIYSINDAAPFCQTISMNLCNVQRGTLVDEMFEAGEYRPPWLWSAVEALKRGKELCPDTVILSDPVGAGSMRGPHNCGKCDKDVAEAIRIFSLRQDTAVFNGLDCECRELWKKVVELEDYAFGAVLVR